MQMSLLMGNRPLPVQNSNYSDDRTESQVSPSITMTNGIICNEKVVLGIGVGFEMFDRNLFPVFLDIRRTLWDNKVSPFFSVKIGYAFSGFKKKHYDNLSLSHAPHYVSDVYYKKNGGFLLNPEIGVKLPFNENTDLLFTVGYRLQKVQSTVSQNFGSHQKWEYKANFNRLSFGVALMFR